VEEGKERVWERNELKEWGEDGGYAPLALGRMDAPVILYKSWRLSVTKCTVEWLVGRMSQALVSLTSSPSVQLCRTN